MKEKIKQYVIQHLLMAFLKKKNFFGSYADNVWEMKKFKADRNIITMMIEDDKNKFSPSIDRAESVDALRALVNEQARQYSRKLRKKHKATIWYVEDHFFTRLFGCRPGKEDVFLAIDPVKEKARQHQQTMIDMRRKARKQKQKLAAA